jgi:hypothetical protein
MKNEGRFRLGVRFNITPYEIRQYVYAALLTSKASFLTFLLPIFGCLLSRQTCACLTQS